uniref:Protein tweety homolog n=1 Tax=Hippocampus comes TaxID=109280 RepID=A0A3Q2YFN2_HIPCM
MTTVPSYTPSLWVRMCHALPRLDLTMQMRDNLFAPDSWEYQQVVHALSAIALVISLLVVLSFLIHYCCCHRICCVTWVAVASVTLCCVAIGIGFYGNSEANDGMYQLTSSLLTANYTLASIDLLISDTINGLQLSVSGPLTTMEEMFTGSKPFLVSTRNCRRLSENVINLLSSISAARSGTEALCLAVFANPKMENLFCFVFFRWLSYVMLLLLDLIVCLFILLGLAKQARWLLILMTVLAWLALFLSWGSLGLETATVVALSDFCTDPNTFVLNSTNFNTGTSSGTHCQPPHHTHTHTQNGGCCRRPPRPPCNCLLTQSQRALSNIHTHLSSVERNALTPFPKAEKSLRDVQQILNSTEGNFHQLVALLNCRGLNKDYIDSLKGLCYDGMEGLLYLSLYSFLSALAFTAILCSLPGDSKRFLQWQPWL